MFEISAPYPSSQTTTLLPNPNLGDSLSLTDQVSTKRAMDGTLYTYVKKKNGRTKFQWDFKLTRNKGLELQAFIRAYFASQIKVIDHRDRVWVGYFTNNPFEFNSASKSGPPIQGWPRGEQVTVTLEFEGIQQ